jgi:hypothetical protein
MDFPPSHSLALPKAARAASVIKAVTQPIARKTRRPTKPSMRAKTWATEFRARLSTRQTGARSLLPG